VIIVAFIYYKWCRVHVQDMIKEYKFRRHHDSSMTYSQKTVSLGHGKADHLQSTVNGYYPYLKGDNYIYTSPRLHHTYVYHGQSPLHSNSNATTSNTTANTPPHQYYTQNTTSNTDSGHTDNDDEYFYVSNHYLPGNASGSQMHQDTAIVMNNGYATTAKHIPVTVL